MIKHEIRWEYILVICIILGTLPCNAQSVIPMPKEMVMGEGSWDVSADTRINYSNDALTKTVSLFNNYLDGRFGVTLKKGSKGKNAIHLQIDKKMPLEAYSLVVDDKGVTIKGSEAGIFYGIQTLQQLLVDKGNGCIQLPYIMINDEPRFGYRGLMLDVARYFYSVEYVKEYIDLMARYKINRFHWHLTEDAGWRIEIKKVSRIDQKLGHGVIVLSGGIIRQNKIVFHMEDSILRSRLRRLSNMRQIGTSLLFRRSIYQDIQCLF